MMSTVRMAAYIVLATLFGTTSAAVARTCTCGELCIVQDLEKAKTLEAAGKHLDELTDLEVLAAVADMTNCIPSAGTKLDVAPKATWDKFYRVIVLEGPEQGCSGVVRISAMNCPK